MNLKEDSSPYFLLKRLTSLSFIIPLFVLLLLLSGLAIFFSLESENLRPEIAHIWGSPGFIITPEAQRAKAFDTFAVMCAAIGFGLFIIFIFACIIRASAQRKRKTK